MKKAMRSAAVGVTVLLSPLYVNAQSLETVTVYGEALTSPTAADALKNLVRVPGGVSLVDLDSFEGQATQNLQDVLAYAPGVFAQTQTGGDQTRLSIRGSGIAETVTLRGVAVLRDGLPLTQTNGQFRSTLLDPGTAEYLEIYRGANALQYGAGTLGGAINLVSPTGLSAPGICVGALLGEHDLIRPRVTAGFAHEQWDAYVAVAGAHQQGFREHLEQRDVRTYGNYGWHHSSTSETRVHVDFQDLSQQTPGALTLAMVRDDPTQADPRNIPIDARAELQQYRAAVQHTLRPTPEQRLDVGVYYQLVEFESVGRFGITVGTDRDVGLSARHEWTLPDANGARLVSGGRIAYGPSDSGRFAIGAAASAAPKRVRATTILSPSKPSRNTSIRWRPTSRASWVPPRSTRSAIPATQ